MATEYKKMIKPAGQGGDYTSLSAWAVAESQDLVVNDRIAVAEIDGDWTGVTDGIPLVLSGWTTDATHYIDIHTTPTARHSGKWDDTKYRLVGEPVLLYGMLVVQAGHVIIEGLQVAFTNGRSYRGGIYVDIGSSTLNISKNLFRGENSGHSNAGVYFNYLATNVTANIFNNILYNFISESSAGIHLAGDTNVGNLYNNTIYNCTQGIWRQSGNMIVINNISYNNAMDFSGIFNELSNYNFSKDDTAPGLNSIHGDLDAMTPDFIDITPGIEDFHIQNTSDAKAAGIDNSGLGIFMDDIDGETRSSPWSIGADQLSLLCSALQFNFVLL